MTIYFFHNRDYKDYYYITPKGDGNSLSPDLYVPLRYYYYITPKGDGNRDRIARYKSLNLLLLHNPERGRKPPSVFFKGYQHFITTP